MRLTIQQRRILAQAITMVSIGLAAGFLYPLFSGEIHVRYAVVNAVSIGVLISLVLVVFELGFFRRQVRRVRFIYLLALRALFYLFAAFFITFNVLVISRMRRFDYSYVEAMTSDEFIDYVTNKDFHVVIVYALLIMVTVNFTRQLSRKLGQGMMLAYITGRYRRPVSQERIVLFIDLIGSKQIIEKLGAMKFHEFLNDMVFDITESIVKRSGIILHYVEDEVVVSWSMRKGLNNSNCIRSVFEIMNVLRQLRDDYYRKYGFTPGIRAAMHCGTLVRAELGMVKTEIASVGDAMNTVSRILDECHRTKTDILLSADLAEKMELPVIYKYSEKGDVVLKGKANPLRLYTVNLIDDAIRVNKS